MYSFITRHFIPPQILKEQLENTKTCIDYNNLPIMQPAYFHYINMPGHLDFLQSVKNMDFSYKNVSFLVVFLTAAYFFLLSCADPTEGFTNVPLTQENFEIQRPYDIPLEERYSFLNGTHRLWVYANDKPHDPNSHTQPRTEVRIRVRILVLFSSIGSALLKVLTSNLNY